MVREQPATTDRYRPIALRGGQHTASSRRLVRVAADPVSISACPITAENRVMTGQRERDLLFCNKSSQFATLVKRRALYGGSDDCRTRI